MASIQLTERFLMNTGGWQALKHAKALVQMGRVVSYNYTPPVLRGLVRDGETEYRAGLKIRSYTDVENLCSCRESRDWGIICAHSLALGLASIRFEKAPTKTATAPAAIPLPVLVAEIGTASGDNFSGPVEGSLNRIRIELHIVLPPNLEAAWEKDQIIVGLEVQG